MKNVLREIIMPWYEISWSIMLILFVNLFSKQDFHCSITTWVFFQLSEQVIFYFWVMLQPPRGILLFPSRTVCNRLRKYALYNFFCDKFVNMQIIHQVSVVTCTKCKIVFDVFHECLFVNSQFVFSTVFLVTIVIFPPSLTFSNHKLTWERCINAGCLSLVGCGTSYIF